jgi:hypothetical protein
MRICAQRTKGQGVAHINKAERRLPGLCGRAELRALQPVPSA